MSDTMHYPPSRKYDVNEEYADAERELSEAWLDLYAARDAALHGRSIPKLHTAPTWQTEPPTEAGWYWIIGDHGRMEAYEVPMFEAQDGNLKYNNPVTVSKVLLWWPIPITMPEPPE